MAKRTPKERRAARAERKGKRMRSRADKLGISVDELAKKRHARKEKLKGIARSLGASPDGILTKAQGFEGSRSQRMAQNAEDTSQKALGVKPMGLSNEISERKSGDEVANAIKGIKARGGLGDSGEEGTPTKRIGGEGIQSGGGMPIGNDSPVDRQGVTSNASAIYRKKKGWSW